MNSNNPDNNNSNNINNNNNKDKDIAPNSDVQLATVYTKAKSYIPQIEQVYQGTNPNIQEAKLLGELLQVLAEVPKGTHLFCDPILEPISIFSLTIFSFNEEATATWLKNHFNPILSVCDKCILNFARGKCKMLQHFAIQRHVPHEHVAKFNDIVCQWRVEAVFPILRNISVNDNTGINITNEIETAMYECLCNPHMLRLNKQLKATFEAIFKFFYDTKHRLLDVTNPLSIKTFISGVIFCWCEGSKEENEWSRAFLKDLYSKNFHINLSNLTPDIIEEVYIHILFLQNPANWTEIVVSQFWSRLLPVFNLFDKDVFIEYFQVPKNVESLKKTFKFPLEPIFKMWYNHLSKSYHDKPLDFLLRGLTMFLNKFGSEFWSKIEPFTFHSILDIIFNRDSFPIKLIKIQDNPIVEHQTEVYFQLTGSVTDLLSWTLPFYHALSPSKRIQMVRKVSMAFLRIIANYPSLKSIPKACLMNSATALLRAVLTIKENERAMLYKNDEFETVLLTKTDSRALLNNPLIQDIIIRSASNPNDFYPGLGAASASVATSTMMVLAECIDFDILLLCHRTFKLYSGKPISEIPISTNVLENVTNKIDLRSFHDGPLLAKQLLVSLKNINGLLIVPSNTAVAEAHNALNQKFLLLSTRLMEKFADILPGQLSKILADEDASQGFWSCIFSSDKHLYQAATNILYNTFDVEGRLEGILAILNSNLTVNLKNINVMLQRLINCEFYEPCPRAVRVLMDVVSAFVDPISGVFANFQTLKSQNTEKEFLKFWESCWLFLDTIYKFTLKWASKYDYSELENFTKDTLDLSRSLVDSFREFSDILHDQTKNLLLNVLETFKNMLYWLRLSDEVLLESCVRLIISTSDLAHEKHVKVDDSLVEMMAKYASKAKRFSNKLTEQQASEILQKAKIFNKALTEEVATEAENYRKEKELSRLGKVIDLTDSVPASPSLSPSLSSTIASSSAESRADYLQRKALSSSITGRPRVAQPKITSFGTFQSSANAKLHRTKPVKPLSKMELARMQLLNNRVVHPPSAPAFHTKSRGLSNKNDDSSSEESDNDIESARELFAIAKAKGKGIQTVDINGKVVKRQTAAELAKQELEHMRKRLNVDMNPLYEIILQWDYTRNSEYPDDEPIGNYSDVKDFFNSPADYQKVMKPLLLLESWQGLCSSRDREDYKPFSIIVGNRTAVSDFYDVYASVAKQVIQDCGISESDLIVMAYLPDFRPDKRLSSDDFKKAQHTCLAKVRTLKNTKGGNVDVTLRIHRNHSFSKFLTLRSEIYCVKVMQMTTIEREYSTLEGLEYYDLVGQILQAKPSPPVNVDAAEIETVKKSYKLNTSQAEAIVNSVSKEGFSLIQGPPGTGKTKTILGIIGYFLSTKNASSSNVIKVPLEKNSSNTEQLLKKQKILICAPSNAAVDEICLRLKSGVYDKQGHQFKPQLVRVGRSDVVNVAIKDLTLEELVDKRIGERNYEIRTDPELERKFNNAVTKRRELRGKLDSESGNPESPMSTEDISKLQLKIRELSKIINELGRDRDEMREKNSVNYRNRDLDRRNAQAHILAVSDIICSTLSGSAHDVLATMGIKFDTVIIDEACQCTELSSIIPLRYGGKRCIMVGDPNQLPPTVLSGAASNFKYNQSLFVRMEKNSSPYLLDVQYRMHPSISKFPSSEFYQGRLKDGPGMDILNKRPWHQLEPLAPYKFFDIISGRQEQNAKTMSYTNMEEIRVAIELVDYLFRKFDNKIDFTGKIGIISPYREQMQKMRKEFARYFGGMINKSIDFNTIDGFQGQEKEIILISCVRADDTKSSVGFLKDFRRMNVALTRAKTSIWVLGHQRSLAKSKLWRDLIEDAKDRSCLAYACSGFLDPRNNRAQSILRKFNVPVPSEQEDDYKLPMEYITQGPDEVKSNKDTKKRRVVDEGEEADKAVKKKKKEKKKEKKKSKADDKKKNNKKAESPSTSSGTKKKSSIFGGMSVPSAVVPKTFPDVDSNKKAAAVVGKKKNNKHVCFSDDVSFIPRNDEPEIKVTRSLSSVLKEKQLGLKETRTISPPEISNNEDDDDEDDYTPSISDSSLMKSEANGRNNRVASHNQNFSASIYDDPQVSQAKQTQVPAAITKHRSSNSVLSGGSLRILTASDYGEPNQNGQNGANRTHSQHVGNANQYSTAPVGTGELHETLPAHPQDSYPAEAEDPYDLNPHPQPQSSAFKGPGSGPTGTRNSSRRNASSSPFIPKKRKPRS
ncbi:Sen1p [Saccharomyces cerevisiae YJM1574]|nr:Sen1p [Saccharomyces cerevisiae YJM1574]